ncbi:MAG: recombinase family protein [Rhodopila sp.]|jgi:DNA invertase Pin-like site-specific DNA recombinase
MLGETWPSLMLRMAATSPASIRVWCTENRTNNHDHIRIECFHPLAASPHHDIVSRLCFVRCRRTHCIHIPPVSQLTTLVVSFEGFGMDGKFVSYLRVSTAKQGQSGLGLEAQREAVQRHLNGGDWKVLGEYVEVETGKKNDRPQLAKALEHCRLTGAVLIVAKLDRLARDQHFLMSVYKDSGEGGVVFCDLPTLPPGPVGKFMVQQMAAVAELEAGLISQRTKDALAKSTKKLGGYRGGPVVDGRLGGAARRSKADAFAARLTPVLDGMQADGLSLNAMAGELTKQGILTAQGGTEWTATAVRRVLARTA